MAAVNAPEEFKINTEKELLSFVNDINRKQYTFPETLTKNERAWVHNFVKERYGSLTTKSNGTNNHRKLTVSKRRSDTVNSTDCNLFINSQNLLPVRLYLKQMPSVKERKEYNSLNKRFNRVYNNGENRLGLNYGLPLVPTLSANMDYMHARTQLPIWPFRDRIMQTILNNQVLIVRGETGSGKTTQLPQFILDYCGSVNQVCRVLCTQPRRISAVSISNRVALERGEEVGQSVGYQIRLESCISPKTSLVYCTNGILLRTLMGGTDYLKLVTHLIVDEVHERDQFSDFLLICLRECLVHYPNLRLILMSATVDTELFQNYFNNAPVIHVPGREYFVSEYYLEDILTLINYESPSMFQIKRHAVNDNDAGMWSNQIEQESSDVKTETDDSEIVQRQNEIPPEIRNEMEEAIEECIKTGSNESFCQFLNLVLTDNMPINIQHSQTGYTGLMAAAIHGDLNICMQLITYGADTTLVSYQEKCTAIEFAFEHQHMDCYVILKEQSDTRCAQDTLKKQEESSKKILNEMQETLDLYSRSIPDGIIDFDLLHALLFYIYSVKEPGSILVFLTGYDDIVLMRERILNDIRFDPKKFELFMLHSLMSRDGQCSVFNPIVNKRKIILATNIAESSITIDDVKYVIDTGKVKERSYDAIADVGSLQINWISQASAKQRAGRAGRTQTGECYHLFSKVRYNSLQEYVTPEILRMSLNQLCLQVKLLAPVDVKIEKFLSCSLEPPSIAAINSAIRHLQSIGALNTDESLTVLGQHLVDLPVEPRLAKMLIYSVIFKCLDPILTIVAFETERDPFVLPASSDQKYSAMKNRSRLSSFTYSDHMILLRLFQEWQDACVKKTERIFCRKNFVSCAIMETVFIVRMQLLAQLRAIGFVHVKPSNEMRDLNENANNWALIKAVLTTGLVNNIAFINTSKLQVRNKQTTKISLCNQTAMTTPPPLSLDFHPESSHQKSMSKNEYIRKIPSNWLIYDEITHINGGNRIRSVTSISPLTVALFANNCSSSSVNNDNDDVDDDNDDDDDDDDDDGDDNVNDDVNSDDNDGDNNVQSQTFDSVIRSRTVPIKPKVRLIFDKWICFNGINDTMMTILSLRQRIDMYAKRKILNPYKSSSPQDHQLVQLVANLLRSNDTELGYVQPSGIGTRPKIITMSGFDIGRSHIPGPGAASGHGYGNRIRYNGAGRQHFKPHGQNYHHANFNNSQRHNDRTAAPDYLAFHDVIDNSDNYTTYLSLGLKNLALDSTNPVASSDLPSSSTTPPIRSIWNEDNKSKTTGTPPSATATATTSSPTAAVAAAASSSSSTNGYNLNYLPGVNNELNAFGPNYNYQQQQQQRQHQYRAQIQHQPIVDTKINNRNGSVFRSNTRIVTNQSYATTSTPAATATAATAASSSSSTSSGTNTNNRHWQHRRKPQHQQYQRRWQQQFYQ